MIDERKFKFSEIAAANNIALSRARTMRARGLTATWDSGIEENVDDLGSGWRDYSLLDAIALGCVLELTERGLSAEIAASIAANCRSHIHDGVHPRAPHVADVWIGRISFNVGDDHVGGALPDLLTEVRRRVSNDVRDFDEGGGAGLLIINASNHHRRLTKWFDNERS